MSNPFATDQTFEQEVLKADLPVLVDFSATWCGPCKTLAPILEELAGEYAGRLKVVTCDAEVNRENLKKYGVTAFPTVVFFKNGEVVSVKKGAAQKPFVTAEIERILRLLS